MPEIAIYRGGSDGRVTVNGEALDPRLALGNHAPTGGFGWGYMGSGPLQLALAILCDHFRRRGTLYPEGSALAYYRAFMRRRVASLPPGRGWLLTTDQIELDLQYIANEARSIAAAVGP